MRKRHHAGTHHKRSALVRKLANTNPNTICWACGRTLEQHPPHRTGRPAQWQAGHTIDGTPDAPAWTNPTQPPPPGAWLAPEASTCNTTRGAHLGAQRQATGYTWP